MKNLSKLLLAAVLVAVFACVASARPPDGRGFYRAGRAPYARRIVPRYGFGYWPAPYGYFRGCAPCPVYVLPYYPAPCPVYVAPVCPVEIFPRLLTIRPWLDFGRGHARLRLR